MGLNRILREGIMTSGRLGLGEEGLCEWRLCVAKVLARENKSHSQFLAGKFW